MRSCECGGNYSPAPSFTNDVYQYCVCGGVISTEQADAGETHKGLRISSLDPQLGWVPAIPMAFHNRRWSWKKFRMVWIPYCREHDREFADDQEWKNHYVLEHLGGEK